MADEPIIVPQQFEPTVHRTEAAAEQPTPSEAQQRLADDVFTNEQEQAAATVLALQAGLGITGHLAAETVLQNNRDVQHLPPRQRPRREEEPEH